MARVIFFAEDELALNSFILDARDAQMFPGWDILAGDTIDDAFAWCEEAEPNSKAIFVVDSRMTSELLESYLERALAESDISLHDLRELTENEVLTGALGTLVLKWLRPDCRTILVTAFYRTIGQIRAQNRVLDRIFKMSVDRALAKREPAALTQAIRGQIATLETHRYRQP